MPIGHIAPYLSRRWWSILVRIGDDLYTCDGWNANKLGELTPAKILAQCALYSRMADGFLWHIGPLGRISRAEEDITMSIDLAYWVRKQYGAQSDTDREDAPDF